MGHILNNHLQQNKLDTMKKRIAGYPNGRLDVLTANPAAVRRRCSV